MKNPTQRFTGHDKRVTLALAELSTVCLEKSELHAVLTKIPAVDWELGRLPQADLEVLYAEFDDDLENAIRSEFEADPSFLVDLGAPTGTCPLCGHTGCRFIFKLINNRNGQEIKCGSECILTYGISVKGAETAEAARKLLEGAIRKAIKAAKIIAWHKEYNFEGDYLTVAQNALRRIRRAISETWVSSWIEKNRKLREVAHAQRELGQLIKFYDQHGWLNTKTRWESWLRVAQCALADDSAADNLPAFKAWVQPVKRVRAAKVSQSVQLALGGI